jgi:hypothetical protein
MKNDVTEESGTLCDECCDLGFCFRYDHEALRKWYEERFVLNESKIKNFIPLRRELGYKFGDIAEMERKVYQNMYDAFHQDDYPLALEYANELNEHYKPEDSWLVCTIICNYFLANYQYAHDLISDRIEHYHTPDVNSILSEVLLDCKNKLRVQHLAEKIRNAEPTGVSDKGELELMAVKSCCANDY